MMLINHNKPKNLSNCDKTSTFLFIKSWTCVVNWFYCSCTHLVHERVKQNMKTSREWG